MRMEVPVLFLFLSCLNILSCDAKSKPIVATMSAKWKFTPLPMEASEFMAEESPVAFWTFVEGMVEHNVAQMPNLNQRTLYDLILQVVEETSGQTSMSSLIKLLKFSLAMRYYSPKIEMFHQLALDVPAPSCDLFFEVRGHVTCSWSDALTALKSGEGEPSALFKQDHIYPGPTVDASNTVIVYANFLSTEFADTHHKLVGLVEKGSVRYVLRHYVRARPDEPVRLSGYGVELALKKTEYKAVDDSELKDDSGKSESEEAEDEEIEGFDFKTLRKANPDLSPQLTTFRNHLQESTNEMRPMKVWQFQDLSYQAAARVLSSPNQEQLRILKDISQNFPIRARSLIKQNVPDELRNEIKANQRHSFPAADIQEGGSALFINGIPIDLETTDVYTIMDTIRSESRVMEGLTWLDITGEQLKPFLHLDVKSSTDSHFLDIRSPAVIWLNDLEKDPKYKRWPSNLHELLRPAFPGTIRRLRKNWCHLVFVVDLLNPEMKHLMMTAEALWANEIPIRFGFVFLVSDEKEVDGREDPGVGLIRAYNFAKAELTDEDAFTFIAGVYKSLDDDGILTAKHVMARVEKKFPNEDLEEILGIRSDYDEERKLGKTFFQSSGLTGDLNILMNGELLAPEDITEETFEDVAIEKVFDATRHLQRAIYMGEVSAGTNILDFFMERPEVVPRFNDIILKDEPKFIDFQALYAAETAYWSEKEFSDMPNAQKTATLVQYMKKSYLSKSDSANVRPVSMWIVADVETPQGRRLVYNALKHVKSSGQSRVGIIHNPTDVKNHEGVFTKAVESALATQQNNNARNFIMKIMKEENAAEITSGSKKISDYYVGGMDEERFEKLNNGPARVVLPHIPAQSIWSRTVLSFHAGKTGVVVNGRVIGPLDPEVEFLPADFQLLESVIYSSAAEKIKDIMNDQEMGGKDITEDADLIMKLTALLATQPPLESERQSLQVASSEHSVIKLESRDEDIPAFEILAVLDPASEEAQQIVPLIMALYDVINAEVRIYMNCREKLSDMPVKRFYRYVLDTEPKFKMGNFLYDGPMAKFNDMPSKVLLTMTLFPPEGWMVAPVRAVYDLDNIKLEEVLSASVTAEYELEYLLLEGHATDVTSGSRPGGLQFTLGTKTNPVIVDTIVMANLGYFQLKANPGSWFLKLREGKSQDIYDITGHAKTDSPSGSNDVTVLMDGFKSRVILVKVSKKPDKLEENLLDDEKAGKEEATGIWDSIANTLTGGGSNSETAVAATKSEDVINIFTLASGHLYERLMRIMIVSLLRNTQTKVKFWILKNYLSPHFKNFIPNMAEKYGFDYELVQYKWPTWLNQQKEKQRTMWGYKILFLDVLFPLGVDKIIFVDADQIVRADLKELRDLDLDGNPYGYTPFCDDRPEMDGFRFWKQGYWASHLAGRKYHISAIYVVDLKKFRRIAAGDRLRGQYQGLSQDPNSLANLDQDLPNNMIHQVGIKSLPQEWLWCETWCSDSSKTKAKTIDLCNNPKTKESKLTAAVRIAPEWVEYDNEIKELQKQVEGSIETRQKDEVKKSQESGQETEHTEL